MTAQLELIEIGSRAREFLALEVAENQRGLIATMAESYADALLPPDYGLGEVILWFRGDDLLQDLHNPTKTPSQKSLVRL